MIFKEGEKVILKTTEGQLEEYTYIGLDRFIDKDKVPHTFILKYWDKWNNHTLVSVHHQPEKGTIVAQRIGDTFSFSANATAPDIIQFAVQCVRGAKEALPNDAMVQMMVAIAIMEDLTTWLKRQ